MNCEELELHLNHLLDERGPLELNDAAAEHVSSCAACRGLIASYEGLIAAVRNSARPAPSVDCGEAVAARWSASRRRRRFGIAVSIVVAASVLFVALLNLGRDPQPSLPGEGSIAEQPQTPELPQTPSVPEESLASLADEARQSYLALAQETETGLADAMRLLPAGEAAAAADHQGADVETPQESNLAARMTSGFEPLTRSTAGAVKFLFGVVPSPSENTDDGKSL